MKIPSPIKSVLVIFASVIGTIVFADLLFRLVGFLPQVDHEWLLGPNADSRISDEKIILVRPRFRKMPFYAVDPARKTVVTLGDSFTEGFPVDDSNNYPSVLGRLLDERGMPVNIINMGMGDSGPDQQLRLMKEYVLPRLTPDIVVWAFYANDVWDNLQQAVYEIINGSLVPLDTSKHLLYIRHRIYLNIPLPGTL